MYECIVGYVKLYSIAWNKNDLCTVTDLVHALQIYD